MSFYPHPTAQYPDLIRFIPEGKDPLVHLYPQAAPGEPAFLVGNRTGLTHALGAVTEALGSGTDAAVFATVSDGEGYQLHAQMFHDDYDPAMPAMPLDVEEDEMRGVRWQSRGKLLSSKSRPIEELPDWKPFAAGFQTGKVDKKSRRPVVKPGMLHVYGHTFYHDDTLLLGSQFGLFAMGAAIDEALDRGVSKRSAKDFTGVSYDVCVLCLEPEDGVWNVRRPYLDPIAQDKNTDRLLPQQHEAVADLLYGAAV